MILPKNKRYYGDHPHVKIYVKSKQNRIKRGKMNEQISRNNYSKTKK